MEIKIVVASDSHGRTEILEEIVRREKADYYLHCGDSQDDELSISPFVSVKGNCDFYNKERERVFKIGNFKVLMEHGHMHYGLSLLYIAKEVEANIVLTGHTHVPNSCVLDGILFVNPGSCAKPRGGSEKSYAVISFDSDEVDVNKVKVLFKII